MGRVGPAHPFLAALARGPLVADGAMGTALLARGARLGDDLTALSTERPAWVEAIHRGHAAAGAEVVIPDTFASTPVFTNMFVTNVFAAVDIARRAGAKWVLGSIAPLEPRVGDEAARTAYATQAEALAEAGVDALLVETFYRADDLALAVAAAAHLRHRV